MLESIKNEIEFEILEYIKDDDYCQQNEYVKISIGDKVLATILDC